jgi:hypothetical protein
MKRNAEDRTWAYSRLSAPSALALGPPDVAHQVDGGYAGEDHHVEQIRPATAAVGFNAFIPRCTVVGRFRAAL